MAIFLIACGVVLICWGGAVLATGDYIATLDIAAGLVGTGVVVIALAAIVRVLDQLRRVVPARWDQSPRVDLSEVVEAEPAIGSHPPVIKTNPQVEERATPAEPEAGASGPTVISADSPVLPRPSPTEVRTVAEKLRVDVPPTESPIRKDEQQSRSLIREGAIDGRTYRFYTDGSIEADGPDGTRHYASMAEAREEILRGRTQPSPERTAIGSKPGAEASPPLSVQAEKAASRISGTVTASGQENSPEAPAAAVWDGYLVGGRTSPTPELSQAPTRHDDERGADAASTKEADEASEPQFQEVRAPSRPPSLEQNWSDSFRQLLKKGAGASPAREDAEPPKS